MKKTQSILAAIILVAASTFAQGFKVKASGEQTFNFQDKENISTFGLTRVLDKSAGQ